MLRHPLFLLLFFFCCACGKSAPEQNGPAKESPVAATPPVPAETAPEDSAFQIIPGQRIGQLQVGDSPEKVQTALGTPDAGDAAMGKALSTWYSKGAGTTRHELNVFTVRENTGMPDETVRVQQIRITSPRFTVTPYHLSTGSTLAQIRKAFPGVKAVARFQGKEEKAIRYVYDATREGIAFEIESQDSTCVGIAIHTKGRSAAGTYLPVHPTLEMLTE